MSRLLYFAYGSNILCRRLEERVGPVNKIGAYSLQGYKMLFNSGQYSTYANVEQDPNCSTLGILYELRERQIATLDSYEGYPRCYEKFYKIDSVTINGIPELCVIFAYWTVSQTYLNPIGVPALGYINLILDGCVENNFIELYNELFEIKLNSCPIRSAIHSFTKKKYKGRVPIPPKIKTKIIGVPTNVEQPILGGRRPSIK